MGRWAVWLVLFASVEARAGALDRFEKPHTPPPSAPPSSEEDSSKKKSSSHHSSSSSGSGSSSSSGSGADGRLYGAILCVAALPVLGACLAPAHRPVVDPYEPPPPPTEDDPAPRPAEVRLRHYEVDIGGFVARNEPVFSRTLAARGFLGPMVFSVGWDRLYETPEPGALARLDLMHFGTSSNLLATLSQQVELYPWIGALLMRGNESTWGFDLGGELRIYPVSPLSFRASTLATLFRYGPTLFDSRLEVGVSFDRFELHGGLRWLTQAHAQGFVGPTAAVTVRL